MKRVWKWGDAVVVGAVLLAALFVFLLFLPKEEAAYAAVYLDGTLIDTLPLNEDVQITYTGNYHSTVTVRDGKVAVTASDCPGEDCVHSGWIDTPARSIVCLPGRLEIRITADASDVDFVVR